MSHERKDVDIVSLLYFNEFLIDYRFAAPTKRMPLLP